MGLGNDKRAAKVNRHGLTLKIQSETVHTTIREPIDTFRP